jgi:hypothetical protein
MSDSQDYTQEIQELLAALRSESITAAQAERIVVLLRESPEARRCFLLSQGIAAVIHRTLAEFPATRNLPAAITGRGDSGDLWALRGADESPAHESGKDIDSPSPPVSGVNPPINPPTGAGWLASNFSWINETLYHKPFFSLITLLFVGAVLISMWGVLLFIISKVNATSAANSFVAQLTCTENCQWAADSGATRLGQCLTAGMVLKLQNGVAYLRYADGALAVMNGPVEFTIEDHGGYLHYGNVAARVPPTAMSFTIKTPKVQVVDFGTEFGVHAEKDGLVDVHVFQGQVQAWQVRGDGTIDRRYPLASQMAMRIPSDNQPNLYFMANRQSFPAFESSEYTAGYQRWNAYKSELIGDVDLLAHYDFQNCMPSESLVPNSSLHPLAGNFNAARYGATEHSGRWPEKKALSFKGRYSSDYVEINPSSNSYFNFQSSFSVALWFRVEQFDAPWQTLIAKGDQSWRLQRFASSRCIFAGLSWRGQRNFPKVEGITPVDDRRWHLATAVFECGSEFDEVRLYLDGRLEGSDQRPHDPGYWAGNSMPVRIGDNAEMPGRNFSGLIDEVSIFQRALTPEEILRMYQTGISLESYK